MRTTLSIDDDVLFAVKERAVRDGRTVGSVLSELARQALTRHVGGATTDDVPDSFFGFEPLPSRGDAVSNALIDRLRDDEAI